MQDFNSEMPQMPQPPDQQQILALVKPPAIALIVVAVIGMLLALLAIGLNLLGMGLVAAEGNGDEETLIVMLSGGFGVLGSLIGLLVGAAIIMGALKMMKLQSWAFALAVSIVAMVPIVSPCCVLGLPVGIWALIILCRQDVKAAFTS